MSCGVQVRFIGVCLVQDIPAKLRTAGAERALSVGYFLVMKLRGADASLGRCLLLSAPHIDCTLNTACCTQHNGAHCTLHTAHCTPHNIHTRTQAFMHDADRAGTVSMHAAEA
eukprot:1162154-Pelagomonas_calceolata.AAC.1